MFYVSGLLKFSLVNLRRDWRDLNFAKISLRPIITRKLDKRVNYIYFLGLMIYNLVPSQGKVPGNEVG